MDRLLFLGVGTIASAVRRALPGLPAVGTTRTAPDQRFRAISPIAAHDVMAIRLAAQGANVVVSFPPDGSSDRAWSELVTGATSIAYLSSTAVYPSTGVVTECSNVGGSGERAALRLAAEQLWLDAGASVVRLPAFYGLTTGLHVSLARGTFRMPNSGSNIVSRVHEDDAARFVRAALRAPPRSLLLAGDDKPCPVVEVVHFVSALFGLALPVSVAGEQIPLSLRASRTVDNRVTKVSHAIQLTYPTYREGYQAIYEQRHRPTEA